MRVHLQVVQGKDLPRRIELETQTLAEARQEAAMIGYTVLSCRPAMWDWRALADPRRANNFIDIPVFIEQLRDLLAAGLSVIEALDALRRGAKGASVVTLERLERQLREGKPLSDAFASETRFPPLLVALVRASELTSDLPQALSRFLEHEERAAEVRHRLISTAIYPLLLMGVGTLVLVFLMFYVMPRFARVFEGMNGDLPWSARAMVAWSQWLASQGAWWLAGLAALAVIASATLSSQSLRTRAARRLLAIKPIHERITTYFLAQWYRATGMLVQGGIPLPQALNISNGLLPSSLQSGGAAVLKSVNEGLSPSAAHASAGMATPVAEQLMLAGERTGDLGAVLARIAHFHESEVTRSIERGMRALEPIVMVGIGLGVGLVVVLMYMPIFELAATIQ